MLVDTRNDCQVELQEGEADAYLGHDTFIVGMIDQDPTLDIVDEVEKSHYGIAIGRTIRTFAQYVNGVLQQLRDNGWLREQYEGSLGNLYRGAGMRRCRRSRTPTTRPIP